LYRRNILICSGNIETGIITEDDKKRNCKKRLCASLKNKLFLKKYEKIIPYENENKEIRKNA